jgi:hypothetical protein
VIELPGQKNGFLACPSGHRVQSLKSRSLWQVGLFSFFVAFWLLLILSHLLLMLGPPALWFALIAVGVWSLYLAIRGTRLAGQTGAMRAIGRQYLVVGASRLVVAILLGWLQAERVLS